MDLSQNRILSGLPHREREALSPLLQEKKVHLGDILTDTGAQIRAVLFPLDAAISMVNVQRQSTQTVDVALIGREGCYGCSVVQGSDKSPSTFMVEVGGKGVEVETAKLLEVLPRLGYLRAALDRYNYLLTRLIVISVGCSQFHSPSERLARWLMSHCHRTGMMNYPFSLEFLAAQTGLNTSILRNVLNEFGQQGLVESGHNTVTIAHPEVLETRACQCVQLVKDATREYLDGLEDLQRPQS
jgi:hypothetical protein